MNYIFQTIGCRINKLLVFPFAFLLFTSAFSQTPALPQSKSVLLMGGVAHLGNGKVIENSAIGFKDGKITLVADATTIRLQPGAYDTTIDI